MKTNDRNIPNQQPPPDAETKKKQQSPNDPSTKMKDGTNDELEDSDSNEESTPENEDRNSVQEDLPGDEQVPNPSLEEED